jgi:type I restriction enzyme S subunit
VIVADPKFARLGDVADVRWGDTSTTKASYVNLGFPAYSASGPDGFLSYADFSCTGVVLSAIGADCGKTWLAKGRWSCIKNTIRFWATDPQVETEYLYWATRDPSFWPKRGSAQPFISQGDARDVIIRIPPIEQQRAIVGVLGALEDKIELNRKKSATLEAMARALFRSWFVDFDPVRAKADGRDTGLPPEVAALFPESFEASELGEIPRGWRAAPLGEVAVNKRLGISHRDIPENTPYIGLEHMPRRSIALERWDYAESLESNKAKFQRGDILFGKLRPYFHKVGVAPLSGVCSTDILVATTASSEWFGFVLMHLCSDALVAHTDRCSTGTKMPRASWEHISRYEVALPPIAVAAPLTSLISPMVDRIAAAIFESRTLSTIRDALLPKLVSGEVRVGEAERIAEKTP